ncbi:MAG: hypothetical protein JWP09_68 [Candidatus Taylorbacteria bacterium]|nr:hypothetical protein [Candidatus Taylorbacteria bacterium]
MPAEDVEPTDKDRESLRILFNFADQYPPPQGKEDMEEILQNPQKLQSLRKTIGDLHDLFWEKK